VTNYSRLRLGVGAKNLSGVDLGVNFLLSVVFCHSVLHTHQASSIRVRMVIRGQKYKLNQDISYFGS
jgi:hypothetical protein